MLRAMRLLALLVACGFAALVPASADACSCRVPEADLPTALKTARAEADTIVHVRALSVKPRWALLEWVGIDVDQELEFDVLEVFKGEVGSKLVLPMGRGLCEVPFQPGQEYLVYAYRVDGQLATNACSRTRPATKNDSELEWLRTGKLPPGP
jgi:hypothetical protein